MHNILVHISTPGFPGGSDGKESDCNARDLSSIPGSGRSPREGNGYPLQWEENGMTMRWLDSINSMDMSLSKLQETVKDRGDWHTAVHRVAKSWT